jgi:bacterioferritin-associated ferredoxin
MKTQIARFVDEVICPCSGTTRGKIQDMFEQGLDMDAISRRTGAVSGCGGCEWDIQQLLNELAENQEGGS